jgi:integrase
MPIKLVKRPKSDNWYIRGTIRGKRVDESTKVSDLRAAEEVLTKRSAEILHESIHGRRTTRSFAEAAASYLEHGGKDQQGGEKRFILKAIDYFEITPLAQIDLDALNIAAKKLYPDAAPATRNRQFYTPVMAVLNHAAARKWCDKLIIARPKTPQGRVNWITIEDADRLIAACSDHLRPLVIFMLYTGARTGEALWLDWKDVDLSRAHVTFPETKNGEARGVPLHSKVVAALANLKGREGDVFRRPDGEPYSRPRDIHDTSAGTRIKTAFAGACRRAGIADFHPHDLRHTWATWHYAANRDLGALMRLGGWKSVQMVMRYAHVNVGELKHTVDSLPGGNLGDQQEGKVRNL